MDLNLILLSNQNKTDFGESETSSTKYGYKIVELINECGPEHVHGSVRIKRGRKK